MARFSEVTSLSVELLEPQFGFYSTKRGRSWGCLACQLANRLISLASQLAASRVNGRKEVGCSKEELR